MRVRTIRGCCAELKENDPNTAITEWAIRDAIRDGRLPFTKSGNKYLVSMEDVESLFCPNDIKAQCDSF